MKARDLVDQLRPDHQITLIQAESDLYNVEIELTMRCTCKWETHRAVGEIEIDSGYSQALTHEWMGREYLNHLLDQELTHDQVLEVMSEPHP